jgi:hypothetical protein
MKTTAPLFGFLFSLVTLAGFSQDRTTVTANSNEVSDNLDLRAVAHVFGESDDLEDFERRLNDPSLKISNLDLNGDNQVDYMRVIESVEGSTHLIIVQAVVGRDSFQDIATIEVEKDRSNRNVQVQIVGNVFLYGSNYIYEPVYYTRPIIYRHFWVPNYVAYYSPWAWSYYPTYFYAWNPWPIYTYHNHVNYYVNVNNSCYYTNHRRSSRAVAMHHSRRGNAYEKQYPNRSFSARNNNVTNRHELAQTRGNSSREGIIASASNTRDQNSRGTVQTRDTKISKTNDRSTLATDRNNVSIRTSAGQTRGSESIRTNDNSTVASSGTRVQNSVKSKSQSVDRSFTSTSNADVPTRRATATRATETRSTVNSSPQANRTSSKPSRSSDTSMNQSRSSKPTVSAGSPSRSNSSSAARSSQSSQRSSGGNSDNTNNRGGGRS